MIEFKKISLDTIECMKESLDDDEDYYLLAVDKLGEIYESDETFILNSANSCLLVTAEALCEPVLVPDQGGWNGFIRGCQLFDKKVEYLPTDDGIIDTLILEEYLDKYDVKTLYITSLAGYTARQPLDEIQRLCKLYDVVFILDISASVGDSSIKEYGDIQVASTGSPKIINIENGGFINNKTGKLELNKHLLRTLRADRITCAGILNEIDKRTIIEEKTLKSNQYLKNRLIKLLMNDETHIVHPEHEGLNTIIIAASKSKAKKLAYNIRRRLNMNGNIITVGPNYNRIKRPSITIEVKNIDINSLTEENLDKISDIIVEEIRRTISNY